MVVFADLTFGGGGHSRRILDANNDNILMAMDCDPDAASRATEEMQEDFGDRFRFVDSAFQDLDKISSPDEFDGILLDLGISSFQLSQAEKGFSFRLDAPIDMRLDPRKGMSAADFLENASRRVWLELFVIMVRKEDGLRWLMRFLMQGELVKLCRTLKCCRSCRGRLLVELVQSNGFIQQPKPFRV